MGILPKQWHESQIYWRCNSQVSLSLCMCSKVIPPPVSAIVITKIILFLYLFMVLLNLTLCLCTQRIQHRSTIGSLWNKPTQTHTKTDTRRHSLPTMEYQITPDRDGPLISSYLKKKDMTSVIWVQNCICNFLIKICKRGFATLAVAYISRRVWFDQKQAGFDAAAALLSLHGHKQTNSRYWLQSELFS